MPNIYYRCVFSSVNELNARHTFAMQWILISSKRIDRRYSHFKLTENSLGNVIVTSYMRSLSRHRDGTTDIKTPTDILRKESNTPILSEI